MGTEAARRELLDASLTLVEKRLVARTWGNLSLRIDASSFLVTPSGIPYEDLSPQDMVEVRIADLAWSGRLKPSSEKGLHAMIYRMRPDAGAVVHTHQFWASAVAAARRGIPASEGKGGAVPCARYALPTTKALVRSVERTLKESGAEAILLANHGTACIGADSGEAIARAEELEARARAFVLEAFARNRDPRWSGGALPAERELAEAYAAAGGRISR
jgi:L-fuculose-phosphate aldolase